MFIFTAKGTSDLMELFDLYFRTTQNALYIVPENEEAFDVLLI
jgi:hypothetical protein